MPAPRSGSIRDHSPTGTLSAESPLDLPLWARRLFAAAPRQQQRLCGHFAATCRLQTTSSGDLTLVSVFLPDVESLDASRTRAAAAHAYAAIQRQVQSMAGRHPLRFWNFIPAISAPLSVGIDRYMAFNLGRYETMDRWLHAGAEPMRIPTATGVGHSGSVLAVHALISARAGRHVENPMQRPAYRYSRRYGPSPPCFARATETHIAGERLLLIGGTASVRGEASLHRDCFDAQLTTTLDNLRALIAAAGAQSHDMLALLRSARVYHRRPQDGPRLRARLAEALPHVEEMEFVEAEICRPELLVEIEGVAVLPESRGG